MRVKQTLQARHSNFNGDGVVYPEREDSLMVGGSSVVLRR
jgi:hypothetical protein